MKTYEGFHVDIGNKNSEAKCYNKKLQYLLVQTFLQQPKPNDNDPHQVRKEYPENQKNTQPFKKIGG
jgi:hypothetical protein